MDRIVRDILSGHERALADYRAMPKNGAGYPLSMIQSCQCGKKASDCLCWPCDSCGCTVESESGHEDASGRSVCGDCGYHHCDY